MKKSFFCLFLSLFLFFPSFAFAESVLIFHLEQINGVLQFDSLASQIISSGEDPTFSVINFAKQKPFGEYRIDLFDVTGALSVQSWFDGVNGKFSYVIPHFGIIKGYKIYSTKSDNLVLEGSLEQFVQCNANGICEFEKKENLNTCLSDCTSGKFSQETDKLLKQNNDVILDQKSGAVLLRGVQSAVVTSPNETNVTTGGANTTVLIISGIILLLVGVGIWVLIRLRKRNKQYGL